MSTSAVVICFNRSLIHRYPITCRASFLFFSFHCIWHLVFGVSFCRAIFTAHSHALIYGMPLFYFNCVWFELIWSDLIWFDSIQFNLLRYILIQFNLIHQTPSLIRTALVNWSWMPKMNANSIRSAFLECSYFWNAVIYLNRLIYWIYFIEMSNFTFVDHFFLFVIEVWFAH